MWLLVALLVCIWLLAFRLLRESFGWYLSILRQDRDLSWGETAVLVGIIAAVGGLVWAGIRLAEGVRG